MSAGNYKKKHVRYICVFILFFAFKAQAINQDTRPYEYKDSDIKLNKIYKKILDDLLPSDRILLIKSQRIWIVFRDLDCKWAFPAEQLDCLIDRTDNRTKELENTYVYDVKNRYTLYRDI